MPLLRWYVRVVGGKVEYLLEKQKERSIMDITQVKTGGIVDEWIEFPATIIEIKSQKVRTKKNRLMFQVKLADHQNNIGAWLYADKVQPQLNQTITVNGMLKEYKNVKYIDYARWDALPDGQGTPQNAPQSPNGGQPPPDYDKRQKEEAEGKVRHGIVCAYLSAGQEPTIERCEYWKEYVMTGKVPLPPGQQEPQDDIPW